MSYFEDISKYSGDLSAQRDNFQSLAGRTKERLTAENQEKFNDITQRFEMIGGAISATSIGLHSMGRHLGNVGQKFSMDEQLAKLQAKTLEENPEFSDFLEDARGKANRFGTDFGSKMADAEGAAAKYRLPGGAGKTWADINNGYGASVNDADAAAKTAQGSAQSAYDAARSKLLDPAINDTSTTPRGNKLVGPGDSVKQDDIFNRPRSARIYNVADNSKKMGTSINPELDGSGQLVGEKPTKGLTLDAEPQTTSSANSSVGYHDADEMARVNSSLRKTPGGVETGRIPPKFDPTTGKPAVERGGAVPDLRPEAVEDRAYAKEIGGGEDLSAEDQAYMDEIGGEGDLARAGVKQLPDVAPDDVGGVNNPYQTQPVPEGGTITTPEQLDGVVNAPKGVGKLDLVDVDNDTDTAVGTDPQAVAADADKDPVADLDARQAARAQRSGTEVGGATKGEQSFAQSARSGKSNLYDPLAEKDAADAAKAAGKKAEGGIKFQNADGIGGPQQFQNVKPTIGEGDLSFANEGGLAAEGEETAQTAESAAIMDRNVLAQSENTIGALVESWGAEEGAAEVGVEAAAATGGAMEMASGAGEVIGAGILVAGVLHDVLQKPASVVSNLPNTGKIGFDPNSIGGSMAAGGSGIA